MTSSDASLSTNPTIQTFLGEMFDIFDPDPDKIHLKDIAHALSMICRYGGHSREFYSVAEHCVLIAQYFEQQDEPDLARAALLHDSAEAYMGDLVRPLKSRMDLYRLVEDDLAGFIFEKFGVPPFVPDEVKQADLRITTDEREMLMVPRAWSIDPMPGLGVTLQCWTHNQAEQAYLDTFWRLFP